MLTHPRTMNWGDRQWDVVATAVVEDAELSQEGFDLINEGTREHVNARCLAGPSELSGHHDKLSSNNK